MKNLKSIYKIIRYLLKNGDKLERIYFFKDKGTFATMYLNKGKIVKPQEERTFYLKKDRDFYKRLTYEE